MGDVGLVDKGICTGPIRMPDFDTPSYPYLTFFFIYLP